ncbi:hypothetical protein STEG23_020385 [Scotinomys teguina]
MPSYRTKFSTMPLNFNLVLPAQVQRPFSYHVSIEYVWVSFRRLSSQPSVALSSLCWVHSVGACFQVPCGFTHKAKVFSRCELAKVLHDFGLDGYRGYNLADWVCLAYYTSGFNAAAVDHEADGSTNNGIFQISSRKWCKTLSMNGPNICRLYCSDLLNYDLKDSVICVMKIVQEPQGMGSWEAWRHDCQGRDLSDWVDGCDF